MLRLEGLPPVEIDEDFARRTVPKVLFPAVGRLRNNLSSTLEHFELFPRLERDFALDLQTYYAHQVRQKLARFRKYSRSPGHLAFHFDRQEDILIGLDYFHWSSAAAPLLAHFQVRYAESARIATVLFEQISALRPLAASQVTSAANLIIEAAIEYGKKKDLSPEFLNVWRSVRVRQERSALSP